MNSKSIILFVALSIFSLIAWTAIIPSQSKKTPIKGYSNKAVKVKHYVSIRQGGSSTYSSSGSYSSSRSYSGGSYSYGK